MNWSKRTWPRAFECRPKITVEISSAMNPTTATAVEVCKVLDSLSALAVDLTCDCEVPPDTLILSAQKTRDACAAIEESVTALRSILEISVANGGGPIPPGVPDELDGGAKK